MPKREEAKQKLFRERKNGSRRHMRLLIAEKKGRMKEKYVKFDVAEPSVQIGDDCRPE